MTETTEAPKKRRGGRRKFIPTDEEREKIRALAEAGVKHSIMCKMVGKWPEGLSEKTFRSAFSQELELAPHELTARALVKLKAKIEAGDLGAICFWLKSKAGFNDQAGKLVVPIRATDDFDPRKLSDTELDSFLSILERAEKATRENSNDPGRSGATPFKSVH